MPEEVPEQIPQPGDTGSTGTQQPGNTDITPIVPDAPFERPPLARAMEGLAATKQKSLGGEISATLIAGAFGQVSYDLQRTRDELRDTQTKLERKTEELTLARIDVATLRERVKSAFESRQLRNVSIFAGTVFCSVGIELGRNGFIPLGLGFGVPGLILILFGWSFRRSGSDE
jgi:hypothetical protein